MRSRHAMSPAGENTLLVGNDDDKLSTANCKAHLVLLQQLLTVTVPTKNTSCRQASTSAAHCIRIGAVQAAACTSGLSFRFVAFTVFTDVHYVHMFPVTTSSNRAQHKSASQAVRPGALEQISIAPSCSPDRESLCARYGRRAHVKTDAADGRMRCANMAYYTSSMPEQKQLTDFLT